MSQLGNLAHVGQHRKGPIPTFLLALNTSLADAKETASWDLRLPDGLLAATDLLAIVAFEPGRIRNRVPLRWIFRADQLNAGLDDRGLTEHSRCQALGPAPARWNGSGDDAW